MTAGFDFADAERGLSGTARTSGAALLFDHQDVVAATAEASVELGEGDGAAPARVSVDGVSLELELSAVAGPVRLGGEVSGEQELTLCRVLGEVRQGNETEQVACLGIRFSDAREPDPANVSLTRSIAVAFSDGGLLAVRAARPRGEEGHGNEEVVAVVVEPEGEPTPIDDALLSTQYDEAGRQVRATLELWPGGEEPSPPHRGAGTIVCGSTLPLGDRRLHVAFFRWSMDGRPGLGRYEIVGGDGGD